MSYLKYEGEGGLDNANITEWIIWKRKEKCPPNKKRPMLCSLGGWVFVVDVTKSGHHLNRTSFHWGWAYQNYLFGNPSALRNAKWVVFSDVCIPY